ncbi:hypothetical protein WA158_000391 [Blastocystis sp. Blastoise]
MNSNKKQFIILAAAVGTSLVGYLLYKRMKKTTKKEEIVKDDYDLTKYVAKEKINRICHSISDTMTVFYENFEQMQLKLSGSDISDQEIEEFSKEKYEQVLQIVEEQACMKESIDPSQFAETCQYLASINDIEFFKYSYIINALALRIIGKKPERPIIPDTLTEELILSLCKELVDYTDKALDITIQKYINDKKAVDIKEICLKNSSDPEFRNLFVDLFGEEEKKIREQSFKQKKLNDIDFENALVYYSSEGDFKRKVRDIDEQRNTVYEKAGLSGFA